MHHSPETASSIFGARGQATKLLEATEETFDFVAVVVPVAVNHALDKTVFLLGITTWAPMAAALASTASVS